MAKNIIEHTSKNGRHFVTEFLPDGGKIVAVEGLGEHDWFCERYSPNATYPRSASAKTFRTAKAALNFCKKSRP